MKNLHFFFQVLLVSVFIFSCTKKQDFTGKVLNRSSIGEVKGMDPIRADDLYSGREIARIYEGLLTFHYLKRPYKLVTNLAESMPVASEDKLTYTVKIKKGIFFHDDKCFKDGKGRELVAEDFVYSIKRLADPSLSSSGWWLLDGKIEGLNEWRAKYMEKKPDYSESISGLKALDKYTLQFKLTKPFPQFLYSLAMPYTFAVPKEAVDFYKGDFLNHPVGTGPFLLEEGYFTQSNKISYIKNPKYRDVFYPSEGNLGDKGKGFLDDAGKKVPFVDKLIVHIMPESQPRWLNFKRGRIDFLAPPKDNFDQAITGGDVSGDLKKRGIYLTKQAQLDVTFRAFNNEHPLFKDNPDLRRAMALAVNHEEEVRLFYNNQGIPAQGPIPPGIAGHDPKYKNPYFQFNIEKAKEYLKKAGYPEGKGLPTIGLETTSSTVNRQMGEYFQKSMAKIGVKIQVNTNTWPELTKKVRTKNNMMYGMAWSADYPDAENFLQLLYGPNSSPGANGSNFNHPEINALFEKASLMQDSLERTALYEKINKKAAELVPWIFGLHRQGVVLSHAWVKNYRYSEMPHGMDKYINIDMGKKKEILAK